jgi:ubiquinone biosynthesis protein
MKSALFSFGRTYRHVSRYRDLISILIKYGFQDIVEQLNLRYYVELGKSVLAQRPAEHIEHMPRAVRVRMIIEEMGTTFIKFGQIMSTRPDLMPKDFIDELVKLQDSVPPFPTEEGIAIIERELEGSIDELFQSFERTPVASASIAQVYRAVLPDGQEVALKVQRPDIQRIVAVDTEIMMTLARLAENHLEGASTLQPVAIVEEFSRVIENEMNFHVEARNIERFIENFKDDDAISAPAVFRGFSSRVLLATEYIRGTNISRIDALRAQGLDTVVLARNGANAILRQIFEHGFFHGDPHPGNLLATENNHIVFLDFGMMGRIDQRLQEDLASLLICIVHRDDARITRTVLQLAVNADDIRDTKRLSRALSDFVDRYAYLPLDQVDVGGVLNDLLSLLLAHDLKLPPELYLLIKALITIEGVARSLDPAFVLLDYVRPYVVRLMQRRSDPRRLLSEMGHTSVELYRLLRDAPDEIRSLLKFVKRGELKIDLETRSLEPVMRSWDRDANRLAFAIVVASSLVSSSVVLLARVPPLWHAVSVVGLVGIGISFVMALWLFIAIYTSGHL